MKYFTKFQEEKFSKVPGREGKKMKDRITSIRIWGLEEGGKEGAEGKRKIRRTWFYRQERKEV